MVELFRESFPKPDEKNHPPLPIEIPFVLEPGTGFGNSFRQHLLSRHSEFRRDDHGFSNSPVNVVFKLTARGVLVL